MSAPLRTLEQRLQALRSGRETSVSMTAAALDAAQDAAGEGARAYVRLDRGEALAEAHAADRRRAMAVYPGALDGLPLSVKDLFDLGGQATPAGSTVLADAAPAQGDAAAIRRLRREGAVLVGRTNMTEFAYSGLGINPHYGTPLNPYDRATGRIPGGSSSGAAVSVADGMAAAAIGSDTGGSVRIPAALCGLTGFKPTQRRVPAQGMLPLSPTLDAVGVIAPTVGCCAILDAALAGPCEPDTPPRDPRTIRLGVLRGYVQDGLEAHVARSFDAALALLSAAGMQVAPVTFGALAEIPALNAAGGFAAAESYAWHRPLLARQASRYDPRVLSRIVRGEAISDAALRDLHAQRKRVIAEAHAAFAAIAVCDAWILPTVPRIAPALAPLLADDAAYHEMNGAMLRNPSVVNFIDGCALSIPCHLPGEAPVGLMLAAPSGADRALLRLGVAVERVLAHAGRSALLAATAQP